MCFAWTNRGTLARRSTAAHGPRCAIVAQGLPTAAVSHESRPSRLLARAFVVEARRLGGGGRSEWDGHGEEAAWWRQARQTGPGGECVTPQVL
jgi:hypothetical protein